MITVCDRAAEQCPIFPGHTEVRHVGFPDPAQAAGTEAEILTVFRWVRDGLRERLGYLLRRKLRERRSGVDAAQIASA